MPFFENIAKCRLKNFRSFVLLETIQNGLKRKEIQKKVFFVTLKFSAISALKRFRNSNQVP